MTPSLRRGWPRPTHLLVPDPEADALHHHRQEHRRVHLGQHTGAHSARGGEGRGTRDEDARRPHESSRQNNHGWMFPTPEDGQRAVQRYRRMTLHRGGGRAGGTSAPCLQRKERGEASRARRFPAGVKQPRWYEPSRNRLDWPRPPPTCPRRARHHPRTLVLSRGYFLARSFCLPCYPGRGHRRQIPSKLAPKAGPFVRLARQPTPRAQGPKKTGNLDVSPLPAPPPPSRARPCSSSNQCALPCLVLRRFMLLIPRPQRRDSAVGTPPMPQASLHHRKPSVLHGQQTRLALAYRAQEGGSPLTGAEAPPSSRPRIGKPPHPTKLPATCAKITDTTRNNRNE